MGEIVFYVYNSLLGLFWVLKNVNDFKFIVGYVKLDVVYLDIGDNTWSHRNRYVKETFEEFYKLNALVKYTSPNNERKIQL